MMGSSTLSTKASSAPSMAVVEAGKAYKRTSKANQANDALTSPRGCPKVPCCEDVTQCACAAE